MIIIVDISLVHYPYPAVGKVWSTKRCKNVFKSSRQDQKMEREKKTKRLPLNRTKNMQQFQASKKYLSLIQSDLQLHGWEQHSTLECS